MCCLPLMLQEQRLTNAEMRQCLTSIESKLDFLVDIVQQVNINTQTLEHKLTDLHKKVSSLDTGKFNAALTTNINHDQTCILRNKIINFISFSKGRNGEYMYYVLLQTCVGNWIFCSSRMGTCRPESLAWAVILHHQAVRIQKYRIPELIQKLGILITWLQATALRSSVAAAAASSDAHSLIIVSITYRNYGHLHSPSAASLTMTHAHGHAGIRMTFVCHPLCVQCCEAFGCRRSKLLEEHVYWR